ELVTKAEALMKAAHVDNPNFPWVASAKPKKKDKANQ
ncbi:MAG: hypothetical protein RL693_1323, partial [Verrucomicrobiota bacterium]